MITNLPTSLAGKYPFNDVTSLLRRGMSLDVAYRGIIVRRGIVLLAPSENPQFMWWVIKRQKKGEVPVCRTLLEDIPEVRWDELTIEPIRDFSSFFSILPIPIRVLLGHPKRGQRELRWESQERRDRLAVLSAEASPSLLQERTRKVRNDKGVRKGPKRERAADVSTDMREPPQPVVSLSPRQRLQRVFQAVRDVVGPEIRF